MQQQKTTQLDNNQSDSFIPTPSFSTLESFVSFLKTINIINIKVNNHDFNIDTNQIKDKRMITFVASMVQKFKGNNIGKYALITFSDNNGFQISLYNPWNAIMIDSDNSVIYSNNVSCGTIIGLTQVMKISIFSDIMSSSFDKIVKIPDNLQDLITNISVLLNTMLKTEDNLIMSEEVNNFKSKLLSLFDSYSTLSPDCLSSSNVYANNQAYRTSPSIVNGHKKISDRISKLNLLSPSS